MTTHDIHNGLFDFLQSYSIGVLKPNTILLRLPENDLQWQQFQKSVAMIADFNINMTILKVDQVDLKRKVKTIDLWWRNEINGSLMALFAYLMTLNPEWSRTKIRLIRDLKPGENYQAAYNHMKDLIRQARIDAEVKIVPSPEDVEEMIKTVSGIEADFVFLGMGATDSDEAQKS